MLFTYTCIKSWFFRNHLAIFYQFHSSVEMWLIVYSNDHAPLTVRPIYSSKLRTAQMMIFSLVAMIGLEKCCITSACLQWLCHSGERILACGPLVLSSSSDSAKNLPSRSSLHLSFCFVIVYSPSLIHLRYQEGCLWLAISEMAFPWKLHLFLQVLGPCITFSSQND